jgi:replicative DNA helicase
MDIQYDDLITVAACLDPQIGPAFRATLRREWFTDPSALRCFDACLAVEQAGTPPDFLTVAAHLQAHRQPEAMTYLVEEVNEAIALPSQAQASATRMQERHAEQSISGLGAKLDSYRAMYPGASFDDLRAFVERQVAELPAPADSDVVESKTLYEETCERMRKAAEAYGMTDRPGLWFGLPDLDAGMGGLLPGQVCIIAARPGVGKTSLAVQFAVRQMIMGKRTLFCSYEMSTDELVERMLRLCFPDFSLLDDSAADLQAARKKLESMPGEVLFHDNSGTTDRQIKALARREQARRGLDCIVVDYVQLIPAAEKVENRQQQITAISANMKAMAKSLKIPVVLLSQFSRSAAESDEPMLHHLRESGSLEQDADKCLLLWNTGRETNIDRQVKAHWAKNRQGRTGRCELTFNPPRFLFTSGADYRVGDGGARS